MSFPLYPVSNLSVSISSATPARVFPVGYCCGSRLKMPCPVYPQPGTPAPPAPLRGCSESHLDVPCPLYAPPGARHWSVVAPSPASPIWALFSFSRSLAARLSISCGSGAGRRTRSRAVGVSRLGSLPARAWTFVWNQSVPL